MVYTPNLSPTRRFSGLLVFLVTFAAHLDDARSSFLDLDASNAQVCGAGLAQGLRCGLPDDFRLPWHVVVHHESSADDDKLSRPHGSCAGVLLHADIVLTTASCVLLERHSAGIKVSTGGGGGNQQRTGEWPQRVRASKFCAPSDFRGPDYGRNLAVIKLDRPLAYNRFVRPACLRDPAKNEPGGRSACVTTGQPLTRPAGFSLLKAIECEQEVEAGNRREDELCFQLLGHQKYAGELCPSENGGSGLYCQEWSGKGPFYAIGVLSRRANGACKSGRKARAYALYSDLFEQADLLMDLFGCIADEASANSSSVYHLDSMKVAAATAAAA